MEALFERSWPEKLSFESTTIIRSRGELERLIDRTPFGDLEHGSETYLLATFLKKKAVLDFEVPHEPHGPGWVVVDATGREVISVTRSAVGTPDVMGWLEKQFGKQISSRTWLTVHRILKRMA